MSEQRASSLQEWLDAANEAFWSMDWETAAENYARVLEQEPDHLQALAGYALSLYYLGRYEEALRVYRKLVEKEPENPGHWERLAATYEAVGDVRTAAEAAMRAAKAYAKLGHLEKAVENLERAVAWRPEMIQAHYLLARAYTHQKRTADAVREYLYTAALLQRLNKADEALRMLQQANQLAPGHPEVRRAMRFLSQGREIPLPPRPKPPTPSRPAPGEAPEEAGEPGTQAETLSPVDEAAQKALTALAELVFVQAESAEAERPSLARRLTRLSESLRGSLLELTNRDVLILLISQAVDAQTREDWEGAVAELERLVHAGVRHPAVLYDLGWLYAKLGEHKKAISYLQQAATDEDFSLAAHLLLAEQFYKQGKIKEAFLESLEALHQVDVQMAERGQDVEALDAYYESLREAWLKRDKAAWERFYKNVQNLLNTPAWREKVRGLLAQSRGGHLEGERGSLAEMLLEAETPKSLEALQEVQALMRQGALDAALEAAHLALFLNPYFLPLHRLIGDLLWQQGHLDAAVEKYLTLARVYLHRGQPARAAQVLERAREIHPLYPGIYRHLIELYRNQGKVEEVLDTYRKLATVYQQLANLEAAEQTLQEAESWARNAGLTPAQMLPLLRARAALAEARLDWDQAARLYREIVQLAPDQVENFVRWMDLLFRQGRSREALAALRTWMRQHSRTQEGLQRVRQALEALVEKHPQQPVLRYQLGVTLAALGETEAAVQALDAAGEAFLEAGNLKAALKAIRAILRLNPPTAPQYRQLLRQLEAQIAQEEQQGTQTS